MREYCRYLVTDRNTGEWIVYGEKWKECDGLTCCGGFRSFPNLFRKITKYETVRVIKGRLCTVIFWANAPIRCPGHSFAPLGRHMGLR